MCSLSTSQYSVKRPDIYSSCLSNNSVKARKVNAGEKKFIQLKFCADVYDDHMLITEIKLNQSNAITAVQVCNNKYY